MKVRRVSITSDDRSSTSDDSVASDDRSVTSDDSDDRVLLKNDENSYRSLLKRSLERCDFCDDIFSNRYSVIKHNATHIIIPLFEQTTHQCLQCLFHFTSIERLAMHISTKHKDVLINNRTMVRLKPNDNSKDKFKEKTPEMPDVLKSIVEKQVVVKCEDELKEVFVKYKETKNKNGITDENIEVQSNTNVASPKTVKEEPLSPKFFVKENPSSISEEEKESIRHRLLFEEDLEDTLFNDLSADYNVSIETLCQQITLDFDDPEPAVPQINNLQIDSTINEFNNIEIIYDNVKIQNDTTELLRNGKAIHYDILMVPEVCRCKWCLRDFPNRFELLQHEPQHLQVRRRWRAPFCVFCERYIAGNYRNLRAHMDKKHPNTPDREWPVHKCPKCHLKYFNFAKHMKYYHETYKCTKCDRGFETLNLKNVHNCGKIKEYETGLPHLSTAKFTTSSFQDQFEISYGTTVNEAVMSLCQMCYSFMKIYIQNRQNYELVGHRSQVGMQQTCDKCNVKVFEVKVVSRKKIMHKPIEVRDMGKPRRHITNEMRLKNIQNRLKMMKRINKC